MTAHSPPLLLPEPPVRKWRWLVPAAAALALHLLLLLALDRGFGLARAPDSQAALHALTMVSLVAEGEVTKVHNAGTTPRPAAAPRTAPATARPFLPALPAVPADSPVPPVEILSAAAPLAPLPQASVEQRLEPEVIQPDPATYRFSTPPSVTLKYDVRYASADGQNTYGHGTIRWQVDGARYLIEGDAGVLFISALSFGSSGMIDSQGVAPELYREKRFRKAEINTHFHRERNQISFSASEKTYPRAGGEQDRASIIWQLAGIGLGDSEKIVAGAEIPLFVAGIRDGEIWTMRVIGEEDIETGAGTVRSWHFLRTPRPGSFEQTIDLWLAPQLDWSPVRLRQTDANGAWLDMTMTSLRHAASR